jgi:glutaredoxin
MNNKKNILLVIGLLALVIVVVFSLNSKGIKAPTQEQTTTTAPIITGELPSKPTLFFSSTCPHCKVVEEYITKNNVKAKIDLDEKEVTTQENIQALLAVVQKCELPQDSIGVPFF